jgi:type II secretory pathway pseudopilin PulG
MNRRAGDGFALMELLVAVALSVMLMTVLAVVFVRSADTVLAGEARIDVAQNARFALDHIANDLMNARGAATAGGRWTVTDGKDSAGPDRDIAGAHDSLTFMTTAVVPAGGERSIATVLVEYFLADGPDHDLGAAGPSAAGARSGRTLRTLNRRLWRIDKDSALALLGGLKDGRPLDIAAATAAGLTLLEEAGLSHFVLSMNIEVFVNGEFLQVHDSANGLAGSLPLGDTAGDPGIPRKLRVTLRVVEGASEWMERCHQREVWIPGE